MNATISVEEIVNQVMQNGVQRAYHGNTKVAKDDIAKDVKFALENDIQVTELLGLNGYDFRHRIDNLRHEQQTKKVLDKIRSFSFVKKAEMAYSDTLLITYDKKKEKTVREVLDMFITIKHEKLVYSDVADLPDELSYDPESATIRMWWD